VTISSFFKRILATFAALLWVCQGYAVLYDPYASNSADADLKNSPAGWSFNADASKHPNADHQDMSHTDMNFLYTYKLD
jgi:hypothetical protein